MKWNELNELAKQYHSTRSSDLKNQIILYAIDYIKEVVKRKVNNLNGHYNDVVQECSIACMECIENYNPKKAKFTTYMRKTIGNTINKYFIRIAPIIRKHNGEIIYSLDDPEGLGRKLGYRETYFDRPFSVTDILDMSNLSDIEKKIINDRMIGLTEREMGEKYKVPVSSICFYMRKAKNKIKRSLFQEKVL